MIHEGMLPRCRLIEGDEKFGLVFDEHSILPAREMWRRWRSLDRQDAKQCAVDMKWMRHSDRDDLPDLGRSKLCLDIDASDVIGLSIDSDESECLAMRATFRAACA